MKEREVNFGVNYIVVCTVLQVKLINLNIKKLFRYYKNIL
jgi:hypothetical protein